MNITFKKRVEHPVTCTWAEMTNKNGIYRTEKYPAARFVSVNGGVFIFETGGIDVATQNLWEDETYIKMADEIRIVDNNDNP